MAIGYNKIFVDTAIFIYYLEKHPLGLSVYAKRSSAY